MPKLGKVPWWAEPYSELEGKLFVKREKPIPNLDKTWNAWTTRELNKVRAGIAKGWSASIIALISLPGRSRNAVIGACFRHGLKLPNRPEITFDERVKARRMKAREKYRSQRAVPVYEPVDPGPPPPPGEMTLMELEEGSCRWPYGERAPYRFCGQLVYHNSYCMYHAVMAAKPMREHDR